MTGSARARHLTAMLVDATGSGLYLPLSLLFFHHVTGLPLVRTGVLLSAAALLSLLGNPVAGLLVDRFGAPAVVVGGYLVRAAGFACYPLVDSPATLVAAAGLVAFGDGTFPPSIQALVAEIATGADRDRLLAAQRSLRNAGLGAGGLLAAAALGGGGDGVYPILVLGTAVAFTAAAVLVRGLPRPAAGAAGRAGAGRGYRLVARNRPFLGLTLANVPTALGYTVLAVSLPVYLTRDLGAPASWVGVLYAVNTVGIALLQIPVTAVLTRFRRTRAAAAGTAVFGVAFALFAALGLLTAGPALLVGVFAATALFTAGELMHGATASALVAGAAPAATRGRHLAVYQLSWAVPTALAPAVLTALAAATPTGTWLLLAVGVAGSALALLRLEPRLPAAAVRPSAALPAPSAGDADQGAEPGGADPSPDRGADSADRGADQGGDRGADRGGAGRPRSRSDRQATEVAS